MSETLKKLLLLSLALVLSFSLVAFVGCKEQLPQEEVDQIIAGALAASYDTVSFDMDMPMTVDIQGGSEEGTMVVAMGASGSMNVPDQEMRMNMNMAVEMSGEADQEIDAQVYVLDGWMYTGADIPGYGEQWQKMALTEEMWQQQDMTAQQVELLATAIEVDYKGTETVSGVECYVFEIEPDMDSLSDLLSQDASNLNLMDFSGFDLGELYQELSVKEWLAKDSYWVMRVEVEMVMEMGPDDVGATSDDFDQMTMDVDMIMNFYDYNQPVSIELPPEALDAEEMSQTTAPAPE